MTISRLELRPRRAVEFNTAYAMVYDGSFNARGLPDRIFAPSDGPCSEGLAWCANCRRQTRTMRYEWGKRCRKCGSA